MKYNKLLVLAAASVAFMASCNKNADQTLLDKINSILKEDASKINTCYDAIQDIEDNNIELNEHSLSNSHFEFVYDSRQKQFIIMDGDEIVNRSAGYVDNANTLDLFKSVMVYNTNSKYSQYLDKRAAVPSEQLLITTGFDIGDHRDIPYIIYTNTSDISRDVIVRTYSDYFRVIAPNDTVRHYEIATNVILDSVSDFYCNAEVGYMKASEGKVHLEDKSNTVFFEAVDENKVSVDKTTKAVLNATINIDAPDGSFKLDAVDVGTEEGLNDALEDSDEGKSNFIRLSNDISCDESLATFSGQKCIDLAGYKMSFDLKNEQDEKAIDVKSGENLFIIDSSTSFDSNSGIDLNDCYINIQGNENDGAMLYVNGGKITQTITTENYSASVQCVGNTTKGPNRKPYNSVFNMYGGSIESKMTGDALAASCVTSYGLGATVNIVYGNFISDTCCVACDPYLGGEPSPASDKDLSGSTLTINGGHFTSSLNSRGACLEYGLNATVNVNGGTFTGDTILTMKDGVANISAATFNAIGQYREIEGADGSAINIYNGSNLKIDIKDSNIYSKFGYVLSSLDNSIAEVNFHEGTYSYYLTNGLNVSKTVKTQIDNPANFVQHSI